MKSFPDILKEKRDYYGNTEAAIEFAAEECLQEYRDIILKLKDEYIQLLNESITIINDFNARIDHYENRINTFKELYENAIKH
jgi:hypothetical protein